MQEIKAGDTVLLHKPDGSTIPNLVINVISQTEVQVVNLEVGGMAFVAATAPIYIRGTEPGQWEPMNQEPSDLLKRFSEGLRMANHPITRRLHSLLNIKLSADVEEVFLTIQSVYADKNAISPFNEIRHRDTSFNNDDYFYNLLMMGIQEGLRSTSYFLQQFLQWAEVIKGQSIAVITDIKLSHNGTFGIHVHTLNANYEGFILMSRATLDRLTYFLKYYFQIKNSNPNLYAFKHTLEKNYSNNHKAKQLVEVIKRHSIYLDTQLIGQSGQPTERNMLAHQEYVGFATPNIMYSPDGIVQVVLRYKGDSPADGTEELTDRFNKLQLFIIDILDTFFAASI